MAKDKNKYGQYFTIDEIADFMTSLISKPKTSRVLEPSCGRGVFLKYLLSYGFNNLSAYEIDTDLAREYDFVKYESFISAPLDELYDVIIGNPPYIRWKNLEDELKEELQTNDLWNKYFDSLCDYLFIFILKSIEQLNEGGELIFICTEYWMNTTHSVTLRNYMCEHGYISEIYHFKEAPLFEKVQASFVIFKYVKSSEVKKKDIDFYFYNKKGKPIKEELFLLSCFNVTKIPQFSPDERWILGTKETQEELRSFEKACRTEGGTLNRLGNFCDIGNGMVSGLDAAFKLSSGEEQLLNYKEKACIIDVLKAKDLEQYRCVDKSRYIYMPSGIRSDDFAISYPTFYNHFLPYQEKLSQRYNYGKDTPYWEFIFPRSKSLFERKEPKIFIPCKERISHKKYFRFCWAPIGYYPLQDVTGIVKKSTCQESLEYILAYLNNKRVFDWLNFNGIVKGAIVEFSEAPLASIPYLVIDWSNVEQVKIHNKITQEVQGYLEDGNIEHIKKINKQFNLLFNGKD